MQNGRRSFLGGVLAAGLIPKPTWADAGAPAYLAAAATPDGSYVLCGIGDDFNIVFELPLPARGHAAAAHPIRPEAVAFARRPGTFALVIDCVSGQIKAQLHSPEGRHFYGHGAFSQDGNWLLTTENDYEAGRGRIGVWDAAQNYKRVGEFDSGGIGPHEIKRLPASDTFVVANGGIDTHPDSGRTKLNIPTMQPNLAYFKEGEIVETATIPQDMHKNSIRHIAVSAAGSVAFGMQWQGDGHPTALVGQHQLGGDVVFAQTPDNALRDMEGYIGSIAYAADGKTIAVTSPRGGKVHTYDAQKMTLRDVSDLRDVCGIAPRPQGFALTAGSGDMGYLLGNRQQLNADPQHQWDNHLVAL